MRAALLLLMVAALRGQGLVELKTLSPKIPLDIRYATANNFTGRAVYDEARCFLQWPAAEALLKVQGELRRQGLSLKIYDCYRPLSVQKKFWALVPDERYVADPAKGSRHNRGMAVDLTEVDGSGRELRMPSPYDDFTERAHRDFMNLPAESIRNRERLEKVMVKYGFEPFPTEWWHFDFRGWEAYPVMDVPFEKIRSR